jgi:hypothetical protein
MRSFDYNVVSTYLTRYLIADFGSSCHRSSIDMQRYWLHVELTLRMTSHLMNDLYLGRILLGNLVPLSLSPAYMPLLVLLAQLSAYQAAVSSTDFLSHSFRTTAIFGPTGALAYDDGVLDLRGCIFTIAMDHDAPSVLRPAIFSCFFPWLSQATYFASK